MQVEALPGTGAEVVDGAECDEATFAARIPTRSRDAFDLGEHVRREEHGCALRARPRARSGEHFVLQEGIESRGRLVEDEELGTSGERLHDADLAPVPGAQLADAAVSDRDRTVQEDASDCIWASKPSRRPPKKSSVSWTVWRRSRCNSEGRYPMRERVAGIGDRASEDPRRSRGGPQDVEQEADRRGLACAVRAEEAEHLPGLDAQIELIDRRHGAEPLRSSDRLDRRRAVFHRVCLSPHVRRSAVCPAIRPLVVPATRQTARPCSFAQSAAWVRSVTPMRPNTLVR